MNAVAGFDWDEGNREKCAVHGVSFGEIEEALSGDFSVFPDPAHSETEERFLAIGKTLAGRHVFVAFTLRTRATQAYVRPISARFMHAKEIARYEEEAAKTEK